LTNRYGKAEAEAIVLRLLEDRWGICREKLFIEGDSRCCFVRSFRVAVEKIRQGCPVQHITGFQEFLGRRFAVSPSVLIPRQETEQLVQKVITEWQGGEDLSILDIGTGSGVIAVSLQLGLDCRVMGVDISRRALAVAKKNSAALGADVEFLECDFLNRERVIEGRKWDIVISNPPYIPVNEAESLPENVRGHDPKRALFVSNERPLIFYEKIAEYAFKTLNEGGALYFEINENFGPETVATVQKAGFENVHIEKDLAGKDRFVWSKKL